MSIYFKLVHPQLILFFPLHIFPQFRKNLKDFSSHSVPRPLSLAIFSLNEELHSHCAGTQGTGTAQGPWGPSTEAISHREALRTRTL